MKAKMLINLKTCLLAMVVACMAMGCSTLNGARPLAAGEHEVGITGGGPVVMLGESPIPIPSLVLEGRSGVTEVLERPLDVNYGLNATGLPFGILQVHAGTSWLALDQRGAVPALSVGARLYFANNLMAMGGKAEGSEAVFWLNNQWEVTGSWLVGQQLLYLGLAQYLDFGNPALTLTPFVGASFDPGAAGGLKIQVEARWFAVNQAPTYDAIRWFPETTGSLGGSLGVSYVF